MTVFLSIIGLIFAIAGYEVDLYYGGFKRLAKLNLVGSNKKEAINNAI